MAKWYTMTKGDLDAAAGTVMASAKWHRRVGHQAEALVLIAVYGLIKSMSEGRKA